MNIEEPSGKIVRPKGNWRIVCFQNATLGGNLQIFFVQNTIIVETSKSIDYNRGMCSCWCYGKSVELPFSNDFVEANEWNVHLFHCGLLFATLVLA